MGAPNISTPAETELQGCWVVSPPQLRQRCRGPGRRGLFGGGAVPAGAVPGVAGAAARAGASAGWAPLAGLGGIAGRARVGPLGE